MLETGLPYWYVESEQVRLYDSNLVLEEKGAQRCRMKK